MENPKFIKPSYLYLFCIISVLSFVSLEAKIAEFDDYWKAKAMQAQMVAQEAYNPDPHTTTNSFNSAVTKLMSADSEGRKLKEALPAQPSGACEATNPIDKCWRCRKNWADERKHLATCVKGFASGTTGGAAGEIYTVTDPSDDNVKEPKKGTLRWGAIQKEPLWIIFDKDMNIKLTQELMIASDKTIDGRGAKVEIAGGGQLTMQFVKNVIIHNLHIHDTKPCSGGMVRDSTEHCGVREGSDGDAVSIFGSSNIWVDHLTLSNCADGLVDAVQGSTAVTVSNCMMTHHDHVMLFGASDTYAKDSIMQITVAFNHFGEGCVQRMPRVRWGFFHIVNNDYTHWKMYAIGGGDKCTIISQGNRFTAPDDNAAKEVTKRDGATEAEWKTWIWRSEGDVMENGAKFVESGEKGVAKFEATKLVKAEPGTAVPTLTKYAGALDCKIGKEC